MTDSNVDVPRVENPDLGPSFWNTTASRASFEKPNVLLVTVDSLRADYVFGPKAPDSLETIPRLARDGINYTNAFSNAAYTKASFLSILSGTYPWMFDSVQEGYGPDRPHVASLLSEAGYATAGFHTNTYLGPTYNYDRGFDHYLGRDDDGESMTGVESAYGNLVERVMSAPGLSDGAHWLYKSFGKHLGVQLGSNLYRTAEELNDAVVEWTVRSRRPAFAWVHYMDVHNPYYPHSDTIGEDVGRREAVRLFHRVNESRSDAPSGDIETLERLYRGEIEYFDRQLGDLLQRLDGTLDLDQTIVAFTADHGEAFDEHGHVFHPGSALYDENVHIPFVLDGPGIGQGEVDTPVSNVDLVPTLLSNAGVDVPQSMVGDDVTTYLADPPDERLVFAEAFSREDGRVMATDGRHKLIRDLATGEEGLYDRRGATETHLDSTGENAEVHRELAAALDDHVRSVGRSRGRPADVEVTENVRLQLRKLGYDE